MKSSKFIVAIFSLLIFAVVGFGQEGTPPETAVLETTVAAKPEGVIRIGLMMPKLQIGAEASTAEASNAVREALSAYLKGPTVDVVLLDAKSPTNALIEAGQKECDFILYTGVSKKTKTSLLGSLIKAAMPVVAGQVPGAATTTGAASGLSEVKQAAADGGKEYVNGAVAAKFGARDEVSFEFSLAAGDGKSAVVKGSSMAKVKADGEDVVSTLIEQVGEKILLAVVKK